MTTQPPDSHKVFVVHGRDDKIRRSVFAFLRAINLEPIEWTEAVDMIKKPTPYVGEVLDAALRPAQAIVVVMTPDDEARLREPYQKDDDPPYEKKLTPQPRPNVLFEAGLAMGHAPDRTVLVQVGNIRPFSDVAGRHIIHLDNTPKKRKELAQRLESAGCSVDLKGNDWLEKGDFEIHEKPVSTSAESSGRDDSTAPALEAERQFDKPEVDILTVMAREGQKGCAVSDIAQKLGIHVQRVQYYLDRLCESEHVYLPVFWGGGAYYHIDKKGRAYLVEHNII